ncbi:MAG: Gfo/Idh/MocA family oxidoreductase [Hyphomonadaceae bacterium]|nr:Gfo/Idh/MocA family oxidoreductase [Hyphomonadaceae bacterium]
MSDAPPLRIAFIGGALNSAVGYAHVAATRMDGRYLLASGCFSRDAAANAAAAKAYGVSPRRTYSDWRTLLECEAGALDAMVVLTPTPAHAEMVSACLIAGVPVVCEKALACNSDEAAALLEIRNRTNGYLAVTYNYSGYPIVRELRRLVRAGALGRIVQIHAEMPQEGFVRRNGAAPAATPQSWRLADGRAPTLALDLAVHLHQLIYYTTGLKPLETAAMHDTFGCFPSVVDNASALVRYEEGVAASLWFTKSALGHRNGLRLRIYGEHGAAEWFQGAPEELVVAHADGRREIRDRAAEAPIAAEARYTRFKAGHPAGYVEAFANLYIDIADELAARKAKAPRASGEVFGAELALEGLHFIEAMTDAAAARTWRRVPGQQHQKELAMERAA